MTIQHHLDIATLISYSAGSLHPGLRVVAAAHLDMCETCRRELSRCDAIGGALLSELPSADLDHVDVDDVARIAALNKEKGRGAAQAKETRVPGVPGPLAQMISQPLDALSWSWLGPGVRSHRLALPDGVSGDLRLLRIAPERMMPEHGHGGTELTLVLSGAYRDEIGRFGPGDIADVDCDVEHQPIVEAGEECVCFVASESPAHFKTALGRFVQRFIGM